MQSELQSQLCSHNFRTCFARSSLATARGVTLKSVDLVSCNAILIGRGCICIFCCSLVTTDAFTIGRSHKQGVHPDLRYKYIYSTTTNCESGQPRLPMTLHTLFKVHRSLFLLGYEHQYSNLFPVSNRIWSILLCGSLAIMHLVLRTEILNNNNNNNSYT